MNFVLLIIGHATASDDKVKTTTSASILVKVDASEHFVIAKKRRRASRRIRSSLVWCVCACMFACVRACVPEERLYGIWQYGVCVSRSC